MTEYLTEQEQIEAIKNWIKQYSFVILMGIAIALVASSGWRYWEQRQTKMLTHASGIYDGMIVQRTQNNTKEVQQQAQKLINTYPKTVYSVMASMMLARDAIYRKDYNQANEQLSWGLEHTSIPALKQIIRLRLARVKIAENQLPEALQLLNTVEDKTFIGLIEEIKGDIYVIQKNTELARVAYQSALTELPNAETMRPILQMKYDNLAKINS